MEHLLARLASLPNTIDPIESVDDWWTRHRDSVREFTLPIDRAIVGGAVSDRVGYAFAAGYQSALRALDGSLSDEHIVSFCVTERGGGHPRSIETTLTRNADASRTVTGHKRWSTLAPCADILLVVVREGLDPQGRNRLRVVKLPQNRRGITVKITPPTPFAPEIPHGEISLESVDVSETEVLEGDGYEKYLRPFRTLEDCGVHGAMLGYLFRTSVRYSWPRTLVQEIITGMIAIRAVALADAERAETHLALAGSLQLFQHIVNTADAHWQGVDPEVRDRWQRDRAIVHVAEGVRAMRAESAWNRVFPGAKRPE